MPRPSRRATRSVPSSSAAATAMPATATRSRRVTSEADQPRERRALAGGSCIDLEQDRARAVARTIGPAGRELHAALAEIDGLRRQVERDRWRFGVDARDRDAARLREGDHGPRAGDEARPVRGG